jgi:hypothetical protein
MQTQAVLGVPVEVTARPRFLGSAYVPRLDQVAKQMRNGFETL